MHFKTFVQKYLEDTDYAKTWQSTKEAREENNNKGRLYDIVDSFLNGSFSIKELSQKLNDTQLFKPSGCWAAAQQFLTEIDKFAHYDPSDEVSLHLRVACRTPQQDNIAQQDIGTGIWEFYRKLVEKQTQYLGRPEAEIVSPNKSAFIISLLTFLHKLGDKSSLPKSGGNVCCIYYDKVRLGLKMYLENDLDARPNNLSMSSEGVTITTKPEYEAVQTILTRLEKRINEFKASQITADPYWIEGIFFWTVQFFSRKEKTVSTAGIALSPTPLPTPTEPSSREPSPLSPPSPLPKPTISFADEKLGPIDKTVLEQSMKDIRLHILVEESVIRRIYRALLTGHVILVGPPGTGKTDLARLIPELLWKSESIKSTAYTTTLVTATNEWSARTLIGGIAPSISDTSLSYQIQYGYLTEAILANWGEVKREEPNTWQSLQRKPLEVESQSDGQRRSFRGRWLVIDEFNRAQIDIALGEALTSLDGGIPLRVPSANGSGTALLPLPKDFRIIGTLNSFDRNYLNQISEALKRRFSFVEVQPPSRQDREAERAIVLYKALRDIAHLADNTDSTILVGDDDVLWKGDISVYPVPNQGIYKVGEWGGHRTEESMWKTAWRIFEVIRIYRRLGTAQAIALFRQFLLTGILEGYTDQEQWIKKALDPALCDTLADQLQVLLPDELEAIIWAFTCDKRTFLERYTEMLKDMKKTRPHRFHIQLEALSNVVDDSNGNPLLHDETKMVLTNRRQSGKAAERDTESSGEKSVSEETKAWDKVREAATKAFHLDNPLPHKLLQFIRRLENFKNERV